MRSESHRGGVFLVGYRAHELLGVESALHQRLDLAIARQSDCLGRCCVAMLRRHELIGGKVELGLFRLSQIANLRVADLQADRPDPRLMMPSSRKGRGQKRGTHVPVPIPAHRPFHHGIRRQGGTIFRATLPIAVGTCELTSSIVLAGGPHSTSGDDCVRLQRYARCKVELLAAVQIGYFESEVPFAISARVRRPMLRKL